MNDDSKRQPTALGDILARYEAKKDGKYISREFQDYGYRLAALWTLASIVIARESNVKGIETRNQ